MSAIAFLAMVAVLLVLFGAVLGAELQDKLHEGQRRRMAQRQREINARWRALESRGSAVELTWPGRHAVLPVAFAHDELDLAEVVD